MPDFSIDKENWVGFLEWVTESLPGGQAEIDVLSLDLGAQVEARPLPMIGLAYDRKNDLIEVALDGLDHLIHRPRELTASYDDSGLISIRIAGEDDVTQIIKLSQGLALPPPSASPAWRNEPAKDRLGKHA